MQRSSNRILTTHAGSLPRPADIRSMVGLNPGVRDSAADAARVRDAVADVVKQQIDLGIDVIDDGEFSKPSFVTYVISRLGGVTPTGAVRSAHWGKSRDATEFPDYYGKQVVGAAGQPVFACTGPISYTGLEALNRDLANLKAALGRRNVEAFVPAIAPANIEAWHANQHYKTDDEYRTALADAMNVEYRAIVDAGFLLQVDDPRLVTFYMMQPGLSIAEVRKWAQMQVEVLNHAMRGIPAEKIRYHTCYSIDQGPRTNDMEAKDIVDILLKIKAGAFSFEASNPRHEHEWTVWRDAIKRSRKHADTILIPGVVTHSTVLVEHPELIAERLGKYVDFAGVENVIAGTDCGFATFAGSTDIDPKIAWAKLEAMVQGAEIASRRLKRRPVAVRGKVKRAAGAARRKAQPKRAAKSAKKAGKRRAKSARR